MSQYKNTTYSVKPVKAGDDVYRIEDTPGRLPPKVRVPVGRVQLRKRAVLRSAKAQAALDAEQLRLKRIVEDYLRDIKNV